jgi:hypothetical protein
MVCNKDGQRTKTASIVAGGMSKTKRSITLIVTAAFTASAKKFANRLLLTTTSVCGRGQLHGEAKAHRLSRIDLPKLIRKRYLLRVFKIV